MQSLFNDMWKNQDVITVDHSHDITFKVCFFLFATLPVCSLFSIRLGKDCSFCYRSCRYMRYLFYCIFSLFLKHIFPKDLEKVFRGQRKTRLFLLAIRWLTKRLCTSLPTISFLSCCCLVGLWAWRTGYGKSRLGLKNCGWVTQKKKSHTCS